MSCQIAHRCAGFHDMSALAVGAVFAAEEGAVIDAEYSVKRFDRLVAEGVPVRESDARVIENVRAWISAHWSES